MNLADLNSRVTGPKILVAIGSLLLFKRTTAFSSKPILDPSFLLTPDRWPKTASTDIDVGNWKNLIPFFHANYLAISNAWPPPKPISIV